MSSESDDESSTPVVVGLHVDYCGSCTMPLEYCEFSSTYTTGCKEWRQKYHLDHSADATLSDDAANLNISDTVNEGVKADEVRASSKKKKSRRE